MVRYRYTTWNWLFSADVYLTVVAVMVLINIYFLSFLYVIIFVSNQAAILWQNHNNVIVVC